MSNYRFAFLFDYENFKTKAAPALDVLINGNSDKLQQIAIELVKGNPKIWDFVGYSRIPRYFYDNEKRIEDVINAGVLPWLLLVISNYCSRIDNPIDYKKLEQAGVDERTVTMLTDAKPLGDLLIKVAPKIVPTDYIDVDFNINDCLAGWLDLDDIKTIKAAIQTNIEQTNTSAHDSLLTMLDNTITTKKALILGVWFN